MILEPAARARPRGKQEGTTSPTTGVSTLLGQGSVRFMKPEAICPHQHQPLLRLPSWHHRSKPIPQLPPLRFRILGLPHRRLSPSSSNTRLLLRPRPKRKSFLHSNNSRTRGSNPQTPTTTTLRAMRSTEAVTATVKWYPFPTVETRMTSTRRIRYESRPAHAL